jgi:hypothetical protein
VQLRLDRFLIEYVAGNDRLRGSIRLAGGFSQRACVARLNWFWIVLMLTVAPLVGGLLAFALWRSGQTILGNIGGTMVILGTAVALILREAAELNRATQACLDAGYVCWPEPSAFMRHAIYAVIGLLEVFGLFTLSLTVETRRRNRAYAPEWR